METPVSLQTIGKGSANELFAIELAKVLTSIADPNTDPKAKRVITLTVTFKPSDDRKESDVVVDCTSKLPNTVRAVKSKVFIGPLKGKLTAVEHDPRQGVLFDQPKPAAVATVAQFPAATPAADPATPTQPEGAN